MRLRTSTYTGRLMPQVADSRQQPKSLAHKMLAAHVAKAPEAPVNGRHRQCIFIRDDAGGAVVLDRHSQQHMGYIVPVDMVAVATSPGIQSWSRPEVDPEPDQEHCNFCDNQFTDDEQLRCAACGRRR